MYGTTCAQYDENARTYPTIHEKKRRKGALQEDSFKFFPLWGYDPFFDTFVS